MNETICTGSHLNNRTFKDDELWESFQSTIISGQVMTTMATRVAAADDELEDVDTRAKETSYNDDACIGQLSTMIEHEIPVEELLNMNIDMIPNGMPNDDECYYDCPSFEKSPANLMRQHTPSRNFAVYASPRPYARPRQLEVQFSSPPDNNNNTSKIDCQASPRKHRPETARRISPATSGAMSTASEQSPSIATRTGSMLVAAIADYDDIKDHAQSTPIFSDSGNPSSGSFTDEASSALQSHQQQHEARKTLNFDDFCNAETLVIDRTEETKQQQQQQQQQREEAAVKIECNSSNKENFYDGKYSKFVTLRAMADRKSPKKLLTRAGKVKLLTGFFQSMQHETRSRIPLPVRVSSQLMSHVRKSPQAKARADGSSPTYRTKKSYKLVSSRRGSSTTTATTNAFSSSCAGSESFMTRNQSKLPRSARVKSCSDATDNEIASIDETCKSHSTGDLSRDRSSSSLSSIGKALRSSKITTRRYLKTPKKAAAAAAAAAGSSPKKVSGITSRRSVGQQLRTMNASPVKPVAELRKIFVPSKNSPKLNGIVAAKVAQNSHRRVPKIFISQL